MTTTKKPVSQNKQILDFMLAGGTLTPLQALKKFDCWALSSRISDLNKLGLYKIKSEFVRTRVGKTVSRYSIEI